MSRFANLPSKLVLTLGIARAEEKVCFAFDGVLLPWRGHVKLAMATARKRPDNPVLRQGPALLDGGVRRIGGKFRMGYPGMAQTSRERGQAPSTRAAAMSLPKGRLALSVSLGTPKRYAL